MKSGELEWEEDGEPGVGMEFNDKVIFKKLKEVKELFTKSLKRAELLLGCWTLNERTRGHSVHCTSSCKGKGAAVKSLTRVVRYVFKHGFHDLTTEHDWIFSRVKRKREN